MKALITGINGFVGDHLSALLHSKNIEVYGTDIAGDFSKPGVHTSYMDLMDQEQIIKALSLIQPDTIYHLAGQSNVGLSWKEPFLTLNVNVMGTMNLLEAVRKTAPGAKVLIIGSGDQYGIVSPEQCPLSEGTVLKPQNPYAVSKAMQEQTATVYVRAYGLNVVMVRAFNHIGPGQKPGFVAPDFACNIVKIEKGLQKSMSVGNLEAMRDFSDVRDIVRGYQMLMEKGATGEIYNIGSGMPIKISDLLKRMISLSAAKIEVFEDPEKMRPSDSPIIYADCSKIHEHTGYKPQITLEQTLTDVLDYWRTSLSA
jgi:GDP-4-dehydro-6-deoxy-D-mannose reductase